jgi:hypothetical protein
LISKKPRNDFLQQTAITRILRNASQTRKVGEKMADKSTRTGVEKSCGELAKREGKRKKREERESFPPAGGWRESREVK